jgi:hypothetical protein
MLIVYAMSMPCYYTAASSTEGDNSVVSSTKKTQEKSGKTSIKNELAEAVSQQQVETAAADWEPTPDDSYDQEEWVVIN